MSRSKPATPRLPCVARAFASDGNGNTIFRSGLPARSPMAATLRNDGAWQSSIAAAGCRAQRRGHPSRRTRHEMEPPTIRAAALLALRPPERPVGRTHEASGPPRWLQATRSARADAGPHREGRRMNTTNCPQWHVSEDLHPNDQGPTTRSRCLMVACCSSMPKSSLDVWQVGNSRSRVGECSSKWSPCREHDSPSVRQATRDLDPPRATSTRTLMPRWKSMATRESMLN